MSGNPKPTSYGKALLQIAGAVGGFALALGLGRYAFVESLKPPPPPPAPEAPPPPSVSGGGFTLTSSSIALPDDDPPYPDGAGADLMNANCTACHSAAMALTQPALSEAQWTATVVKMRDTYKAAIADKDVPAIVQYLTKVSAQTKGGEAPTAASSDAGGASG
ncbi:hypothetical protein [Caulobacter sp. FWC2]|uniref:hypothetical protein n=1 Tax=Caulobacter sp. FWC2 TaxID=69664 RepID=UPI000C152985|nr:hypothetical protein [Caulobacter sp. FWC2]PIB92836.1 hypothetical protein CSW62_15425 [Caulobacter sp. FWC2]